MNIYDFAFCLSFCFYFAVFNKRLPEECKPFESSYSEGCPPADWCIGCTVCDCDANGRWDCHVLSFCEDNKGKKKIKKHRGALRNKIIKRQLTTKKITVTTTIKPTKKPQKKIIKNKVKGKNSKPKNKMQEINAKRRKVYKMKAKITTRKPKLVLQRKKLTKSNVNLNKKGKPKKPIDLNNAKTKNLNLHKNITDSTVIFAKNILKKVMDSVEKFVNGNRNHFNNTTKAKVVQTRSIVKHFKKSEKKKQSNGNKIKLKGENSKNIKWTRLAHKTKEKLVVSTRRKREIGTNLNFHNTNTTELYTTALKTINADYFKYSVFSTAITEKNKMITTAGLYYNTDESKLQKNHVTLKNMENRNENSTETLLSEHTVVSLNESHNKNLTCGNICELKNVLKKVFFNSSRQNITRKSRFKYFNMWSKMKRNLFRNPIQDFSNDVHMTQPFKKKNIIKTLCKNIGSCRLKYTTKELQLKLEKLRVESYNILKSVSSIKGLLRLLNISKSNMNISNENRAFTDNDIKILDMIIKDEYMAKLNLLNLTATQRTQIFYIKENTISFIHSVEKFALLLKDIINTLTQERDGQKYKFSNRYYNYLKRQQIKRINKDQLVNSKLEKLKKLLLQYNLVQNKFMKQMFDILSTSEKSSDKFKVGEKEASNYNGVEFYTNNILTNLRKLRNLAEKLNSKNRTKRAAMEDDDAIEYLLTLMEYLLKQNKSIDESPVHDGIDILIEAIKNAPDIKPIKKLDSDAQELMELEHNLKSLRKDSHSNDITNISKPFGFRTFESVNEEDGINFKNFDLIGNVSQDTTTNRVEDLSRIETDFQNETNYKINDIVSERMEKLATDEIKKIEVFIDDTDEDDEPFEMTTSTIAPTIESFTDINLIVPVRTLPPNKLGSKLSNSVNDNDNKTKLDWIEENYNEEEHKRTIKLKATTTEKSSTAATRTIKINKDKYADPISSMSHEIDDERKVKNDVSEIAYKKGMRLLNTLDYGNEKSFLDSQSKEDKYNAESLPYYFS